MNGDCDGGGANADGDGRRAQREVFEEELEADLAIERRLLWKELGALVVVLAVIVLHRVL